ncbi:peptidylprolyl isomerase [Marinicella sp. W31]|uniref:peptidylprolyl isomerase n=1 Tax=Marinicella sp. W31 TaxID=3023713 RepID=UPI003756D6F1
MKLITALLLLLSWQLHADVIAKQGDAEVNIKMFDAFAYSLPNDILVDYFVDRDRLETTVINFLNIELINQYIVKSGIAESEVFQNVKQELEEKYKDKTIDSKFTTTLGYESEVFKQLLFDFDLKKEFYKKLQYELVHEKEDSAFEELAYEQYITKKKQFVKPEKRNISHIFLDFRDKDKRMVFEKAEKVLAQVVADNTLFEQLVEEYSDDPTAESNQGNLGEFTKRQLESSISGPIFAQEKNGIIPRLLENSQGYFIVRLNEVIPSKQISFEETKSDMIESIKSNTGQKKFQNILTEQSKSKIDINAANIEKVVRRYDVFLENKNGQ